MAISVDILQLFPDLDAIGQSELQIYSNEWLQRLLARRCGMAQIVVDSQLNLQIILNEARAVTHGKEVFIPIDELLGYIVDRHFTDPTERRRLHSQIRDARRRWSEPAKDYEASGVA